MVAVEVDKGWAWGTVVGGFTANFLIGGFSRAFGIVMDEFKEVYECPSSYLTLAGGLIYTFMYAMSILVHLISSKVGPRIVMFVGTLLCTGSLIGASLATSVGPWVVFIGVGVGISLSFIYFPCFVMLGRCFSKYIGLANGLAVAGMSVGQAAFPAIVVFLIERYSIRGAVLITAGLSLHFGIAAALIPTDVIKPTPKETEKELTVKEVAVEEQQSRIQQLSSAASTVGFVHRMKAWTTRKRLKWRPTPRDHFDKVLVALYTISRFVNEIGHVGLTLSFPPFGTELSFTKSMIVVAMVFSGVVDLVARLFVGWFSDLHVVRRSLILVMTAFVEAGSGLLLTFTTTYTSYVAVNILFGLCGGATTTLMVVVLTDYVGSDNLSKGFAVMMLCMGFGLGPSQYLLGLVRDITHTYGWTIRLASFFICFGAVVLALDLPLQYCRSNNKKSTTGSDPMIKHNNDGDLIVCAEEVALNSIET